MRSLSEQTEQGGLPGQDVPLTTINGVAYLDGPVASYDQKKAAASIAASLSDVRRVVNRLRVIPGNPRAEAEIRENIGERLRHDPSLSRNSIGVSVDDGVVTLIGKVSSISSKIAAEVVAWSVSGVRHVVNRIKVTTKALDPLELGSAIKSNLINSLGLLASDIDVRVAKGTVYLQGHVASQEHRLAAEDLVRNHPQVRRAVNRLQVKS